MKSTYKSGQIKIGKIELSNPFLAAPMAGITNAPTRLIYSRMGAAMTYSEMISSKGLIYKGRKTEELLRIYPEEGPVAYQIFGGDPDSMKGAAGMLAGMKNKILDINMGCPVPKVVKNGEGSALMKDPDRIYEIISAVIEGTKSAGAEKPVTVKLRSGWDADHINAVECALAAQSAGASAVCIHGRTREQYYGGESDKKIISDVCRELDIPVIASGDVFSAQDAVEIMKQTGCNMVMIARGALGNPWIFREALALWKDEKMPERPSIDEKKAMMKEQLAMLIDEKGERAGVKEMRKYFGWYMKGEQGAASLRRRANCINRAEDLFEMISEI